MIRVLGYCSSAPLINAAREGIKVKGGIMYMNCSVPCTPCLIEIINAGILEIVVYSMQTYDVMANYLIINSNLKVRLFDL